MNQTPSAFESLKAGKGRLYPMPKEKRIEEWNRLKQYDWATKAHVPKFDGFIKINRDLVASLVAALDANGGNDFRYNIKVCEQMGDDGTTIQQLNVDYWIPKPNPNAQASAPAASVAAPADDFLDDDLPF
ncbi:hypothetical protein N8314_01775 [Akkermansiaceae bacterium]|nr:hypothetical protein [Akkermansiaceae bacterium]